MAGDCSSSYVLSHVMRKPVPGRSHRAARRRTAQRDDRTVALNAMDRMRLIDRPEEVLLSPYLLISMRQLDAIQSILAKALLKARESNQGVRSLRIALGEIAEIDTAAIQKKWDELSWRLMLKLPRYRCRDGDSEPQRQAPDP